VKPIGRGTRTEASNPTGQVYVTIAERPELTDDREDRVVVMNSTTHKIMYDIPVGKHPNGVAIDLFFHLH
jgi:YVTN family beta-propeller protein